MTDYDYDGFRLEPETDGFPQPPWKFIVRGPIILALAAGVVMLILFKAGCTRAPIQSDERVEAAIKLVDERVERVEQKAAVAISQAGSGVYLFWAVLGVTAILAVGVVAAYFSKHALNYAAEHGLINRRRARRVSRARAVPVRPRGNF